MTEVPKARKEFRNLNVFSDLRSYRLPPAGWASILHRISGALLFLLLPFLIWLFDKSLSTPAAFEQFSAVMGSWFVRLIVWGLLTAYLYHLFSGIRHLYLDVTHRMTKEFGRQSALAVFGATIVLSLICAVKLLILY